MKIKHSQYLEKIKDDAIKEGSLTSEMADFYQALFLFQEKQEELFDFDKNSHSLFRKEKYPLIDPDTISFSNEISRQLMDSIHGLLDVINHSYEGVILDPVKEFFSRDGSNISTAIRKILEGDLAGLQSMADSARIGIDEFIFIVLNWLKPCFSSLRNTFFPDMDTSEWLQPRCPFCGFHADMSKIVEGRDNIRLLHCGLCDNEWNYRRVTCAVCGNDDIQSQGYFTESDESLYRFDYCDACHGYIKTLRVPKQFNESRYDLTVENIITGGLDAAAMGKGYNRP